MSLPECSVLYLGKIELNSYKEKYSKTFVVTKLLLKIRFLLKMQH